MPRNFEKHYRDLERASVPALKKDGIVESIEVFLNENGRYVAKVIDSFSNSIVLRICNKSHEHVVRNDGLTESLENSAEIAQTDETEQGLEFTTTLYASSMELEQLFQLSLSPSSANEKKGIATIKAILIKKGLRS